jgi:hypothetical protein
VKLARPLLLLVALGCARILAPPGGPPDRVPPRIIATLPESLAVLPDFDDDVEFQFDEVIAEGGSPNFGLGTGDLEKLVLVSPSDGVPEIRWRRDRITARPRGGWRRNTVYRVELLPGLADLSSNRLTVGRIITFTTGAPRPIAALRGVVVDWSTQRPLRNALIEAVHLSDSLVYRTVSDSLGRFGLGPVPEGEYLVYGVQDQNTNRLREARETYDSVRVAQGRADVGEVWVYKHDSTMVRLSSVTQNDSLSLLLTFSQQLNPYQRVSIDSVQVLQLPDSVPVPVLALLPKGPYDTLFPPVRSTDTTKARADSLRAVEDSIRADSLARAREAAAIRIPGAERRRAQEPDTAGTGPLRTKPPLFDRLYLRMAGKLRPGGDYLVIVRGIQSVSRVSATARAVTRIPEEKPPLPDSLQVKPDTTKPPP